MDLLQKQALFTNLVADLILEAIYQGYKVTLGETYRTPEQAAWNAKHDKGIANSLHCKRLAIDLNLFKDGKYLTSTDDYKSLGEWWEDQSTPEFQCCWGGRFVTPRPDGNHFSIEHEGIK